MPRQPALAGRKRARLSHHDYKIALFCVLDVELTVMRAMLDEIHDDLPTERSGNVYILGSLSSHNVVLAVLPAMGNQYSGIVADRLREDFPSVQLGLMVGVGGGIPGPNRDIRLGDIAVAEASSTLPAVLQFDQRKHVGVNKFVLNGHLNKTPELLVSAVKKLKVQHLQDGRSLSLLVSDMLRRYPQMAEGYSYPGSAEDQLFEPNYEHAGGSSCEGCLSNRTISRDGRPDQQPQVHYGTIGSSNTLLRNAHERDRLANEHGILCVEMEAAGLVDQLPCLIVRGICDYADSHKNKNWQPYAAASAAAYAKELLQIIPSAKLARPSYSNMASPRPSGLNQRTAVRPREEVASIDDNSKLKVLLNSLTFRRMDARLNDMPTALPQTCKWLKSHQGFRDWIDPDKINDHHGFLWIKGKPGSGKSTLMKTLFKWEKDRVYNQKTLHYFFNGRAPDSLEKSSSGLYRSLTHQLLSACHTTKSAFLEQFLMKESEGVVEDWTANELKGFLLDAISSHLQHPLVILIDALDEGENQDDIRQLVDFLEDLAATAYSSDQSLRICLSSRHYPRINIKRGKSLIVEKEQGHEEDIRKYIYLKLATDRTIDMDDLRDQIWQKSAHVFLWVVLVIPLLNKAYDDGDKLNAMTMSRCLEGIPERLEDLFETILRKSTEDIGDCVIALQWVLCTQESLSLSQLYIAIGIRSKSHRFHDNSKTLDQIERCLINTSRGLIEFTKTEPVRVQFIHETVRDFLRNGGLARIDSTLLENAEGISHEHLRTSCALYIEGCNMDDVDDSCNTTPDYENQRDRLQIQYPLLKYATSHLLVHAEMAESLSRSQQEWRESMTRSHAMLVKWIRFRNAFEPAKIRRYTSKARLLYIFAAQGLTNLLRLSLINGDRDSTSEERFSTALQAACAGWHEEAANLLIQTGVVENCPSGEHGCAFLAAIHIKSKDLVDLFVRRGHVPPIDVLEQHLFKCTSQGNIWGFQALVKLGCSVNCERISDEMTPLYHACTLTNPKALPIVRFLSDAGVDVNAQGGQYNTALQAASYNGNEPVVRLLLKAGADANAQGGRFGTALQAASYSGKEPVVRLLLEAGADVNAQGGQYGAALQAASYNRHELIVRLLLEAGADVNAQGGHFGTALQAASSSGKGLVEHILLEAGADVNAQGGYYGTALQAASSSGKEPVVRLLLKAGADVNAQGGEHDTALQAASYNRHELIVRLLLEAGADVNAKGALFGTALQAASYHGHEPIVRLLLKAGADVNAQGGHFSTALQAASYSGKEPVVRLLLEAGADVNAQGGYYGTALQAALQYSGYLYVRVADLLREHGA